MEFRPLARSGRTTVRPSERPTTSRRTGKRPSSTSKPESDTVLDDIEAMFAGPRASRRRTAPVHRRGARRIGRRRNWSSSTATAETGGRRLHRLHGGSAPAPTRSRRNVEILRFEDRREVHPLHRDGAARSTVSTRRSSGKKHKWHPHRDGRRSLPAPAGGSSGSSRTRSRSPSTRFTELRPRTASRTSTAR